MKLRYAAAIAAFILAGSGAHADPFATSRSASNPVEDTYQETATKNCSGGVCTLTFPATTHSKTLISHVSCFFGIPSSATVFGVNLGSKTGSEANFVGIEKYDVFNGTSQYVVNAPTYLFFASGEQPTMTVVATGSQVSEFSCTVSGNYH
jgi:hypothetical protein